MINNKQQAPNLDIVLPDLNALAETHQVQNQPLPLVNVNSYEQDVALSSALATFGGIEAEHDLKEFGQVCGSQDLIEKGFQANAQKPELRTHDRRGNRVDEVSFHPAYHDLMRLSMAEGLHSSHWTSSKPGAQVRRAAKYYLMAQVEAGHGCPITMTSAAIPALKHQPELYDEWAPRILSTEYDHRNIPYFEKNSATIGMAMTEKQGGSDIRKTMTRASALKGAGPGQLYELVGHKYFVSAPMCDAFLMLAQTEQGISCFLVPRWRPDGRKNPIQIQQLKNKMGNVSNASSEAELRGAIGWMVGREGKGIATILDMVAMTRFDCMIGSSALMRQAVAQVTHHCAHREAFGANLAQQPLMQNVLADLILESEGALSMTMRMAQCLDRSADSDHARNLLRIGTAIGKYWICKRAPGHAYEAMECIGGSGVMEESIMPRLFRESPINSIWEGSGNVQCLDLLRVFQRHPEACAAYFDELEQAQGRHVLFDRALEGLKKDFAKQENMEYRARQLSGQMALCLQASCLLRFSAEWVADAFCQARLNSNQHGWVYGILPEGLPVAELIDRARPRLD